MRLSDYNGQSLNIEQDKKLEWKCISQSFACLPDKQKVVLSEDNIDISRLKSIEGSVKKYNFRPESFAEFIGQENNKGKIQTAIKRIQAGMKAHFLFNARPGTGKCHRKGTKILMYNGQYKNVEDIITDDLVMGIDGRSRTVINTCTGYGQMYNIIPNKGESFVVNEEHILSLVKSGTDKILNISVKDYINKTKNIKLSRYKLYSVPIEFKEKKLTLDPYFMGIWLGDGTSENSTITNPDIEIHKYLQQYADELNMQLTKRKLPVEKCKQFNICLPHIAPQNKYSINTRLKEYNVLNNKHIPDDFKLNSRINRLKLLAGLLDTDGSYDKRGYEITVKQFILAKDIKFLAKSLGFGCVLKEKWVKLKNWNKPRVYYRLHIYGKLTDIPCKIIRKQAEERRINKNPLYNGFKIEKLEKEPFYGFTLSGDKLYMIEDFIVNHNTSMARLISKQLNAEYIECIGKQLTNESLVDYMNQFYMSDKPYNILFVDEVETTDYNICKILNPLLEDFSIAGRSVKPFIFIACTINKNMLISRGNNDMIDRITDQIFFDSYTDEEIYRILTQYHNKMYSQYKVSAEDINIIAQNCKYCPRIGITLLENLVIIGNAKEVLHNEGIIKGGITKIDVNILQALKNRYPKTLGASALSQQAGINEKDYITMYEPFLNQQGYIERVPMRKISQKGIDFLAGI